MRTKSFAAPNRGMSRLGLLLLSVPVVLLVITGLLAVVWWQYFKSTPAYSLGVLVDSAQRNDTATFDELFDMTQVIENFVKDATLRATNSPSLGNDLIQRLQPVSGTVSDAIKPIVRDRLQERINRLGPAANLPFFVKALAIGFKTNVTEENEKRRVTIIHDGQEIELWLAPHGDQWKVIAVKDDKLAAEVVADITRSLQRNGLPVVVPRGLTLPDVEKLIPLQ